MNGVPFPASTKYPDGEAPANAHSSTHHSRQQQSPGGRRLDGNLVVHVVHRPPLPRCSHSTVCDTSRVVALRPRARALLERVCHLQGLHERHWPAGGHRSAGVHSLESGALVAASPVGRGASAAESACHAASWRRRGPDIAARSGPRRGLLRVVLLPRLPAEQSPVGATELGWLRHARWVVAIGLVQLALGDEPATRRARSADHAARC